MKLHIGCGTRNLPGWSHFDIRKLDDHIDFVGQADDLKIGAGSNWILKFLRIELYRYLYIIKKCSKTFLKRIVTMNGGVLYAGAHDMD